MSIKRNRDKQYPMYHCKHCGYFYKDVAGIEREDLGGQQTTVTDIVCAECKAKKRDRQ